MPIKNTQDSYGSVAKFFHWIIALSVISMLVLGLLLGETSGATRMTLITVHKSLGLTILLLMIARAFWRWYTPKPALPNNVTHWQQVAAKISHCLLYLCVIAMAFFGWLMATASAHYPNFWWLGPVPMPFIPRSNAIASFASEAHFILAWTLLVLVCIHFLAAMKHHFIDKDDVLKRMMPGG